jgi:hypothetical protein
MPIKKLLVISSWLVSKTPHHELTNQLTNEQSSFALQKNQKGVAHLLLVIILLISIPIGLYLVQNPTVLFPKAATLNPQIKYGAAPAQFINAVDILNYQGYYCDTTWQYKLWGYCFDPERDLDNVKKSYNAINISANEYSTHVLDDIIKTAAKKNLFVILNTALNSDTNWKKIKERHRALVPVIQNNPNVIGVRVADEFGSRDLGGATPVLNTIEQNLEYLKLAKEGLEPEADRLLILADLIPWEYAQYSDCRLHPEDTRQPTSNVEAVDTYLNSGYINGVILSLGNNFDICIGAAVGRWGSKAAVWVRNGSGYCGKNDPTKAATSPCGLTKTFNEFVAQYQAQGIGTPEQFAQKTAQRALFAKSLGVSGATDYAYRHGSFIEAEPETLWYGIPSFDYRLLDWEFDYNNWDAKSTPNGRVLAENILFKKLQESYAQLNAPRYYQSQFLSVTYSCNPQNQTATAHLRVGAAEDAPGTLNYFIYSAYSPYTSLNYLTLSPGQQFNYDVVDLFNNYPYTFSIQPRGGPGAPTYAASTVSKTTPDCVMPIIKTNSNVATCDTKYQRSVANVTISAPSQASRSMNYFIYSDFDADKYIEYRLLKPGEKDVPLTIALAPNNVTHKIYVKAIGGPGDKEYPKSDVVTIRTLNCTPPAVYEASPNVCNNFAQTPAPDVRITAPQNAGKRIDYQLFVEGLSEPLATHTLYPGETSPANPFADWGLKSNTDYTFYAKSSDQLGGASPDSNKLKVHTAFCGSGTTSSNFPTFRLVSYWRLDETGGVTINDVKGTNSGTAEGATSVAGKNQNGWNFNGNSLINFGKPSGFNFGSGNFSWSMWVKTTSSATSYLISDDKNATNLRGLMLNGGIPRFICRDVKGVIMDVYGSQAINDGNWHHVVAVRNGNTAIVYVDGVQKGRATASTGSCDGGARTLHGARDESSSPYYFTGVLDEIGVWSRALTASEVSTLFNNGQGLTY